MDAVSSFAYIVDNIPRWKEQVTQLSTYTTQKHDEFRTEYTRLVSKAKPRRIKSPSICSIHTDKDIDLMETDDGTGNVTSPPNLTEISPFEAGNRYIYAQANKKQKPGTSIRSGASGPMKFRSKQMVVIYYDSHVQNELDTLVKSIGGSRNNLRKGKAAYTVKKGFQLPSLGRRFDGSSPSAALEGIRTMSMYRKSSKLPAMKSEPSIATDTTPTGEAAFKQADKDLEACQNLCETAAHQFLRDGDCKLELDTVLQNFNRVSELAQTTLESLKTEETQDEAMAESSSMNSSTRAESETTLVEKPSRELLNFSRKLAPRSSQTFMTDRPVLPTINSAPPATTEIEVDDEDEDSDQSSIEIDMSKYRVTNRTGLRS